MILSLKLYEPMQIMKSLFGLYYGWFDHVPILLNSCVVYFGLLNYERIMLELYVGWPKLMKYYIVLSWVIVYCDYWIELVMFVGKSHCILSWFNWLWMGVWDWNGGILTLNPLYCVVNSLYYDGVWYAPLMVAIPMCYTC